MIPSTLFTACGSEVGLAKRRPGESTIRAAMAAMHCAEQTHPDYALPVGPLRCTKRVEKKII
jgi:hypothetical protein